jgi:hypothetical protein
VQHVDALNVISKLKNGRMHAYPSKSKTYCHAYNKYNKKRKCE